MWKFFLLLLTEHCQQGSYRMFRTPSLGYKQPAFINSWGPLNNTIGFITQLWHYHFYIIFWGLLIIKEMIQTTRSALSS